MDTHSLAAARVRRFLETHGLRQWLGEPLAKGLGSLGSGLARRGVAI